jgi:steroid 5-alpha reductase family enzyme
MFNIDIFLSAAPVLLVFAVLSWLVSLVKNDVSIVDSLWSVMIVLAGMVFFVLAETSSVRGYLVLILALLWAVRLSAYITWRNHSQEEDARYQQIRANNQPHFKYKSLYIVFGLQAFLAWLVALPLLATANSDSGLHVLDYLALALWLFGMFFEVVGDWQMARFKADPDNKGKVMNSGLWRYTRHPNYFGEFCIWWAFFLFALAAGGWWSVLSPLLMTVLLLKVSGVAMLEKDIGERRPKYSEYIKRTNAFFPWLPKTPEQQS